MPIENALTPAGQNALGAAFGYYPHLRRNRTVQDPQAALEMPVQFLRGRVAGTLGMPADIANLVRTPMPTEMFGQVDYGPQAQVPYGTQELLRTLPLAPQSPAQQAAANVGALVPVSPAEALQAARLARQAALAGGATAKQAARVAGEELNAAMLGERQGTVLGAITPQPLFAVPPAGRSGFGAFDPRYDPRRKELPRLKELTRDIELNPGVQQAPTLSLADFEGRPFITSMADRTAAGGKLVGVEGVQFNRPVELIGGQDYMFNNPGQVWASAQGPVKQLMKQAAEIKQVTGQDPLYMPWRMAPTGGDFAAMTGETMLAYADSAMGKMQKRSLDKSIKELIPDWAGVSDPASVEQFRNAKDKTRKAIKKMMDVNFRDAGGLNIGGARLAVSDPAQLNAQTGGVMNVGEIFAGRPMVMESGHPSYPRGVPGQGLGTLSADHNIFELMPEVVKAREIPNAMSPRTTDIRALQMKPYSGIITNELLKRLGY